MSWIKTNEGLLLADTATILNQVQKAFSNAFPNINIDPSTPQGQLITFITERLTEAQSLIAYISNVWTKGGSGVYLDNWAKTFYGITRKASSTSSVDLVISGEAGALIPKGFQASDGDTGIFETNCDVTIGKNGQTLVTATAINPKQHQVLKNTVTTILTNNTGAERITNPHNSTSPLATETDADFYRRALSFSPQFLTSSVFGSGLAQIANLPGVLKVGGYENISREPQEIRGTVLPPHSVNYIVHGGDAQTIGQTLLKSKNPGCAMGGNETVNVTENISGQVYEVKFYRPEPLRVKAEVVVTLAPADNYNYMETIRANLKKYVETLPFGAPIYPINIVAALSGMDVKILDLQMSKNDEPKSYSPIEPRFNEYAEFLEDNDIKITAAKS